MTLTDIMTPAVVTVSMDETLKSIRQIFNRHKFHHVVVVENGKAVGVISDRDILKNLSPFIGKLSERAQDVESLNRRAHQIMTRRLTSAPPEMEVPVAIALMIEQDISCLPVIDATGRCVGIVTSRDMLSWCTSCVARTGAHAAEEQVQQAATAPAAPEMHAPFIAA